MSICRPSASTKQGTKIPTWRNWGRGLPSQRQWGKKQWLQNKCNKPSVIVKVLWKSKANKFEFHDVPWYVCSMMFLDKCVPWCSSVCVFHSVPRYVRSMMFLGICVPWWSSICVFLVCEFHDVLSSMLVEAGLLFVCVITQTNINLQWFHVFSMMWCVCVYRMLQVMCVPWCSAALRMVHPLPWRNRPTVITSNTHKNTDR